MRTLILMLALMPSLMVCARDALDFPLRQIMQTVELGKFDQAMESYHKLLAPSTPEWQQALIHYNIGTTLIRQGQPERALLEFEEIEIDQRTPPLFLRSLRFNRALARMSLTEDKPNVEHLARALADLKRAHKANCQVFSMMSQGMPCDHEHTIWSQRIQIVELLVKQRLAAAREDLMQFGDKIGGAKLTSELLKGLYERYQTLIQETPLQATDLSDLQLVQEWLAKNLAGVSVKKAKYALKKASPLLSQAMSSLDTGQETQALLQLKLASSYFLREQYKVKGTPKEALEDLIKDETHDKTLTELYLDNALEEEVDQKVMRGVALAQQFTLSLVDDYYDKVLRYQQHDYKKVNGKKSCQCKPWDEVLPLVEEGRLAALEASMLLHASHPFYALVRKKQQQAIDAWKKALKISKQASSTEENSKEPPQQNNMTQVFQSLQEMDLDDRSLNPQAGVQPEANPRPW